MTEPKTKLQEAHEAAKTPCPTCHSDRPSVRYVMGEPGEREWACTDLYHPKDAPPHAMWGVGGPDVQGDEAGIGGLDERRGEGD